MRVQSVAPTRKSLSTGRTGSSSIRGGQECRSGTRALRVLGAPALALAYVACGRLDAFCEPDISPWDTLAGSLIIAEAGGRISTFSGAARSPHPHSSIVGSNAKLHDELLAILEVEEGGLPANSSARDFDEHPN